jgi:hypothetical protein
VGSARLFAAFFFLSGCVPPRGDVVRLQSGADAIAEATSAGENHDWCCGQPLRGYDLPGVGELYIAIADEVRCTLAVDKPGFGILRYRSDHCSITRVDDRLCVDQVELVDEIGPLKGQPDKLVLDGCVRVDPHSRADRKRAPFRTRARTPARAPGSWRAESRCPSPGGESS